MECTKCKKKKPLNDYTLKNIKERIYYRLDYKGKKIRKKKYD